ncbi:hypothetical protein [Aeromicrobium wangtongii]|nr:hypothetical protein [Aeromicrobium wangtongii]MCD9198448.1 hypothetical protein [Aeromicrobium wangtongii]
MGHAAATAMVALAAALSGALVAASPAAAEETCEMVNLVLTCTETTTEETPATTPETGTGSGSEGSCELRPVDSGYDNPSAPFCIKNDVCFNVDHFAPLVMPEGDKPNEDSTARVTLCYNGSMGPPAPRRIFWTGDEEEPPSLIEQVRSAVDALDFATPTVGVSPAGLTLVNLDTWFWLDGVQREVTATAFTVTARATIRTMTVDPGDGSGTFTCPTIATTSAEAQNNCVHEYRRSSRRGAGSVDGQPAFKATVTTVYDLTFTHGGNPIPAAAIPGAPTTIDGAPATAAVRVVEAQTVVRPNR